MQSILKDIKSKAYPIEPEVSRFLSEGSCKNILSACSGGADSVFASLLLASLQDKFGFTLILAHYNHAWRGEASDGDSAFVESLANSLGVNCLLRRADLASDGVQSETLARNARIEFLRESAKEVGADAIAYGHQMNDIFESQVLRLARGAGLEGLVAPRPIHHFGHYPTHIRPILNYSADSIVSILREHAIEWREDASNTDDSIPRNFLRQTLTPSLSERLHRNVSEGASRSRRLLQVDAEFLEQLAQERLPECYALDERLDRAQLRAQDRALTRRAFVYWLHKLHPTFRPSASLQDQLIEAIYGDRFGGKFSLGADFIRMNKRHIWLEKG
ncbi:MAG: tRNA lysidine(34) synthetase TilS [Puniceicoccaceae bacterium]|nr:tRNA lysidine(34) synthetase TilS [Puniceicoccaceae bacterium]RCL30185.1 MAG: tRNA lysidine(34) synthetase TilS [Puniceicoccaceae bacterium]